MDDDRLKQEGARSRYFEELLQRCVKKNSGGEMKYRAVIRPETENDLKEAFSGYEDKRKGLGYDFLLQVDAGIKFIIQKSG